MGQLFSKKLINLKERTRWLVKVKRQKVIEGSTTTGNGSHKLVSSQEVAGSSQQCLKERQMAVISFPEGDEFSNKVYKNPWDSLSKTVVIKEIFSSQAKI